VTQEIVVPIYLSVCSQCLHAFRTECLWPIETCKEHPRG